MGPSLSANPGACNGTPSHSRRSCGSTPALGARSNQARLRRLLERLDAQAAAVACRPGAEPLVARAVLRDYHDDADHVEAHLLPAADALPARTLRWPREACAGWCSLRRRCTVADRTNSGRLRRILDRLDRRVVGVLRAPAGEFTQLLVAIVIDYHGEAGDVERRIVPAADRGRRLGAPAATPGTVRAVRARVKGGQTTGRPGRRAAPHVLFRDQF